MRCNISAILLIIQHINSLIKAKFVTAAESSSATDQNRPSPYSGEDGDRDFDYGGDTGEYEDDEETLEEEEAVGDGDDAEELNDLAKVK